MKLVECNVFQLDRSQQLAESCFKEYYNKLLSLHVSFLSRVTFDSDNIFPRVTSPPSDHSQSRHTAMFGMPNEVLLA